MKRSIYLTTLLLLGLVAGGCANISNGSLAAVQPVSDSSSHVGNAYLFRGFIGVFSTGMNSLNEELNEQGICAHVYQADQWADVADTIAERYKGTPNREPIVLVGHSYGADNIVRIAQRLKDKDVKVDLLVTLDPVTPPKVPGNVVKVVNLYQSNGAWDKLPWLRGIPLEAEENAQVALLNENIRTDRQDLLEDGLNHFNIEKKEKIHQEVISQIKDVCITRQAWAARHPAPTPSVLTASVKPVQPRPQPPQQANAQAMAD